jgi:hypothetical protein
MSEARSDDPVLKQIEIAWLNHRAYSDERPDLFGAWPPAPRDIETFLAIADEYKADDLEHPAAALRTAAE